MNRMKDKVVVVTGASAGAGRGIVELLVREGASVVAVARREERLKELAASLEGAEGRIAPFVGDVSRRDVNEQMIDFALETFGRLDVLVNNAGIMDNMAAVGDALDKKYEQVMAINVYGPFCAMRKAINVFLAQGSGGCIINMGSEGARKNSAGAVYCASKAALEAISKNTAFMYADKGIRTNVVAIGALATEISASIGQPSMTCMHRIQAAQATNPGLGQPIDAAYAVLYLASDEARFINGTYLTVDGGWGAC